MRELKKFIGIIKDQKKVSDNYIKDIKSRDKVVVNHTIDMLKKIGHNELEIKESSRSYAILFE